MKRFGSLFVLASSVFLVACAMQLFPAASFGQSMAPYNSDSKFTWRQLYMRNTSAPPVELSWAKGAPTSTAGFTDSTVYRRAVTTLTVYDTTMAIATQDLPFPPHLNYK